MSDAKQCPWCQRWCLKDAACNYVFACGLETGGKFHVGAGCGRSWCWECGKKFCMPYIDPFTGQKLPNAIENHGTCCFLEAGFTREEFCGGGHNSHCAKRF